MVKLPRQSELFNEMYNTILKVCKRGKNLGGINAFPYVLEELTNNMYDHAGFSFAYVMIQRYPKKGFVEIVFVDNGRTIPGSYESVGIKCSEDNKYLQKALQGESTKKEIERGFGLGTSLNLVCEVIGGQMFIISREACMLADSSSKRFLNIPPEYNYQGTLITIRLPYPAQDVSTGDFYATIEK